MSAWRGATMVVLLAGWFGFFGTAAPAGSTPERSAYEARRAQVRTAFDEIVRRLSQPNGGTTHEPGTPGFDAVVRRVWDLAEAWTLTYLDTHPDETDEALAADLGKLRSELTSSSHEAVDSEVASLVAGAVRLATGAQAAYVVSMHWNRRCTIMIVARSPDGRYRVAWRIGDAAKADPALEGQLERWETGGPGYHDGPFDGKVIRVSDSFHGRSRFCVDAVARSDMGLNCPAQISVWEWTGETAIPEFIEMYEVPGGTKVERRGDVLRVRVNDSLRCFFPCGSCVGPEATWSLHVGPDGVEDQGRVADTPELRVLDELLARVAAGKDASGLASKDVISYLASQFSDLRAKFGDQPDDMRCSVGMITSWKVRHDGKKTLLDFWADQTYPLTIHIEQRKGKPFITRIEEHPERS